MANKNNKFGTIDELKEQEDGNFTIIEFHEGTCRANTDIITELDVSGTDLVRNYWFEPCSDGDTKLHILVQPEKVIRYIHIGAPAPQYAINSISHIRSCIVYIATQLGIYSHEESNRNSIPVNVILEPDTTEEQVAELFEKTKDYMLGEDYTGVYCTETYLRYDAGTASSEVTEPTRNW